MRTSIPRLSSLLAIIAILSAPLSALRAQGLNSSSSLAKTPSDIERGSGAVQSVIDRAEQHYKLGELSL
jgi:hypothetical protein